MPKEKKISIITPGGLTNFGERAIMLGTIISIREKNPKAEIAIFGYENLEAEDKNLFKKLKSKNVEFRPLLIKGHSKIAKLFNISLSVISPRLAYSKSDFDYIKDSTVYSKGQESFTQSYSFTHFVDSFIEQLIASRISKKVILYGHSIGPINKHKGMTRSILNRIYEIDTRDSRSTKELRQLGYRGKIKQINDLAYTAVNDYLKTKKKRLKKPNQSLIVPNAAICLDEDLENKYLQNISKIINTLHKKGRTVVIGSSVTAHDWNNDYKLCEKLIKMHKDVDLKHFTRLDQFLDEIYSSNSVISSRLHPIIMATGMNINVVAVSKSNKIIGLLQDRGQKNHIYDPFKPLDMNQLSTI